MYFDELLPRLAKNGDDGNYAVAADADLACLQVRKQCHTSESITNVCIVRYKATTVTTDRECFLSTGAFKEDQLRQVRSRSEVQRRPADLYQLNPGEGIHTIRDFLMLTEQPGDRSGKLY